MDSSTIINLTQIAANVVTATSIIVVIIQLRSAGRDRRLDAVARSIESHSSVLTTLAENQQLADVYSRGLHDSAALTPSEEVQFSCFVGQLFWSWEMIFHHSVGRRIAPGIWGAHVAIIDDVLTTTGAVHWWRSRRRWYTSEFQKFIDGRIDERCGVTLHGWSTANNLEHGGGETPLSDGPATPK